MSLQRSSVVALTVFALTAPSRVSSLAGGGFGAASKPVKLTYAPDTSDAIAGLVDFLRSRGAEGLSDGVEVGVCATRGIRGVYATRAFKKGDELCRVPSACALALSDPSDEDAPDDLPIAECATNFLDMYAANAEARVAWAPWLDTLPTSSPSDPNFSPTPDFWSDDAVAALEHPRAVRDARERRDAVAAAASDRYDEATLRFAAWIVSSRSRGLTVSDEGRTRPDALVDGDTGVVGARVDARVLKVLTPYLDLVNHSSDDANARFQLVDPEKDDSWFTLRAKRPIAVGKEITVAYGSMPGAESSVGLLADYGFVPDRNKIDEYILAKEGREKEGIPDLDGWSTTLEEDLAALETAEGHMRTALSFRIRLKQSYKKKKKGKK